MEEKASIDFENQSVVYNTTDKIFKTKRLVRAQHMVWTTVTPGEGICPKAYPYEANALIKFNKKHSK